MILFIDTETSGMVKKDLPLTHKDQPHLMQIALILTSDTGDLASSFMTLVEPSENYLVDPKAEEITGLTWKKCRQFGMTNRSVCETSLYFARRARLVVAHNMDFDQKILDIFFARYAPIPSPISDATKFCTMRASTPILKIPGKYDDYKWPSLKEAYKYFFNREPAGTHNALGDAIACMDIYFKIKADRANLK